MGLEKIHFDTPLDGVIGDPTLVAQPLGPRPAIPGPPPLGGTVEPGWCADPDEGRWQDRAACATVDPALFFPSRGESTKEAKAVCRGCPVQGECLEYALANGEKFGIWGGKSERERRRLRKDRGISKPRSRERSGCGTYGAYKGHLRRGETPCESCAKANRLYQQECRERRRGSAA